MKRLYLNIFLATVAAIAVNSCSKNSIVEPAYTKYINIAAKDAATTKALLNQTTFQTSGNRIQIIDIVDGTEYINDLIGPDVTETPAGATAAGIWPFEQGPYYWTQHTHKFFGWLAQDGNFAPQMSANSFFNTTLQLTADHKLEIPTATTGISTTMFDFLYSDIIITEPLEEPVPLEFNHLFSAFYIAASNSGTSSVTVKKVTINGLNNTKSATIDFSGTTPSVIYISNSAEGSFIFNNINETLNATEKNITDTYLIWPQNKEDFSNVTLTIEYTADGKEFEPHEISLANIEPADENSQMVWESGKINVLNIMFNIDQDLKQITFTIETLEDWGATKDIPVYM